MLDRRTKRLRLASLLAALALVPACSIPRAGLVAGAVTTVIGVALVHDAGNIEPARGAFDPTPVIVGLPAAAGEATLGAAVVAAGVAMLIGGAIGLAQESTERPAIAAIATEPAPPPAPSLAPPGSATAALEGRSLQLAVQLRIEARAGHCEAATAIARRLALLDRARTIALIERDPDVESCVGYRLD